MHPYGFFFQSKSARFYALTLVWISCFLLLSGYFGVNTRPTLAMGQPTNDEPQENNLVYLPVTRKLSSNRLPIMTGVYPTDYWLPSIQERINLEFHYLSDWAGKRLSIAGSFHSFEQYNSVDNLFIPVWNNGLTPFVNIYTSSSLVDINSGRLDREIRAWAQGFQRYANGGERFAFLAPLQEMNGDWVPYAGSPANFKAAYQRIRNIFAQEGVPDESVAWVFAPNGYSPRGYPPFEDFYPGDALVDVVGFSAYNFGYHPDNPYKKWQTPEQVFGPYIVRMKAMAPSKPLFIAQTGTTAYTQSGVNNSAKNAWLRSAYPYLAEQGVWAVIYYNDNPSYDFAFFSYGNYAFEGYREGVAHPAYGYLSPTEVKAAFR